MFRQIKGNIFCIMRTVNCARPSNNFADQHRFLRRNDPKSPNFEVCNDFIRCNSGFSGKLTNDKEVESLATV